MKKKMAILAGLVVVALLAIGLATNVMAQTPPQDNEGWWQQMLEACPGASGTGGAMMGGGYAGGMGGYGITEVATLLGVSPQDLVAQRNAGKSVFQLADEKGVSEQQVLDAAMAQYVDMLAIRVKYKYLTEDQAAQARQQYESSLRSAFGATGTTGTPGGYGPRGMMGGGYGGGMMGGYGGGTMGGFGPRGNFQ